MSFFDGFRRLVVVLDVTTDLEGTLAAAERIAPSVAYVHFYCLGPIAYDLEERAGGSTECPTNLGTALAGWHERRPLMVAHYAIETALDAALIGEIAERVGAQVIVFGPLQAHSARDRANVLMRTTAKYARHALSVGSGFTVDPSHPTPLRTLALALDAGGAALNAMAPLLLEAEGDLELVAMASQANEARCVELEAELAALLPGRRIRVAAVSALTIASVEEVDDLARRASADLVITAADAVSDLEAMAFGFFSASDLQKAVCPTLVLARTLPSSLLPADHLVASDTLALPLSDSPIAVERIGPFGRVALATDDPLVVTERDSEHRILSLDDGAVTLPRASLAEGPELRVLLLSTSHEQWDHATARVLLPTKPLILIDASIETLPAAVMDCCARDHHFVFARLRRSDALASLRERLAVHTDASGPPLLIDASAWLDDGGAEDVPRLADAQRLLRLGLRLIAGGARVELVVTRDRRIGSRVLSAIPVTEWEGPPPARAEAAASGVVDGDPRDLAFDRELDVVSGAVSTRGHTIAFDLDNLSARRATLDGIAAAAERIHWQCYIVDEDEVASEIASALAAAAARGVKVRVLVDALYSGHEVFGLKNSLLSNLDLTTGVTVRAFSPLSGIPDLAALKRRNHRKCVVFDGRSAIVTGRNLGAPYYSGFDEVTISPSSPYRDVPWLDSGARLAGPLVSAVERGFADDWVRAGGERYEVASCAPIGDMIGRYVLHEGLSDTHTFDSHLAMIRLAQRELVVINAFPLVVELQRALVAAIRRGVRVRLLFGSVRPRHGKDVPFSGGIMRSLPEQLVRSRLDVLVARGAEVYEFAIPPRQHWDPLLGRVFPYVHAKLLVRDRRDVAIGSANLDVTAAYWESEAMLLVHDEAFANGVLDALAPVFATSQRIDGDSVEWQCDMPQRAWLSRHWPSLIG